MKRFAIAALAALLLTACSGSHSEVGLVDASRITANWPKFANLQNQLNADEAGIVNRPGSKTSKQQALGRLQAKYAQLQDQLAGEVRSAATKVAQQRNLKLVVTRQNVGYGGNDITSDVEKELGITEKATPSP